MRARPIPARRTDRDERLLDVLGASLRRARADGGPLRAELSVDELSGQTDLARSSVQKGLEHLAAVVEPTTLVQPDRPGNNPVAYRLRPGAGHVVGVALQHDHLSVTVADLSGHRVAATRTAAAASMDASPDAPLRGAARFVAESLEEAELDPGSVVGVGIAMAAAVDRRTGRVRPGSGMAGWRDIDPTYELAALTGLSCPFTIGNDASLAALAEHWWGAGAGLDHLVYVEWSEGIGGGLILNGELYEGATGTAGDFGHTYVPNIGGPGPTCPRCQRKGCLETLASTVAICAQLGMPVNRFDRVMHSARAGDAEARKTIETAARRLGAALTPIVNMLEPEALIIGGHFDQSAYRLIVQPLREGLASRNPAPGAAEIRIETARAPREAPLDGALALVLREHATAYLHRQAASALRPAAQGAPA